MKEVGFTVVENELLNKMAVGELDCVIDSSYRFWLAIRNGIPTQYLEEHTEKDVVNGEVVRALGEIRIFREWKTEEEKLDFLKKYRRKMDDPVVQEYAVEAETMVEPKRKLIVPLIGDVLRRVYNFDWDAKTVC